MKKVYIGVDPGSASGAVAVLDNDGGYIESFDMPLVKQANGKSMVNAAELALELGKYSDCHMVAVVEQVNAMPGGGKRRMGATSAFQFGFGTGIAIGCLATLGCELHRAVPQRWRKAAGIPTGADKDYGRTRAIELYPTAAGDLKLKKSHNKGDAILIARYGRTEIVT